MLGATLGNIEPVSVVVSHFPSLPYLFPQCLRTYVRRALPPLLPMISWPLAMTIGETMLNLLHGPCVAHTKACGDVIWQEKTQVYERVNRPMAPVGNRANSAFRAALPLRRLGTQKEIPLHSVWV